MMNDYFDTSTYVDENTPITGIFYYQSKKIKMSGRPPIKMYPGIWFMGYDKHYLSVVNKKMILTDNIHNIFCTHCMQHSMFEEWKGNSSKEKFITHIRIVHPLTNEVVSPIYICPKCGAWNYKGKIYE